MSRFYGVRLWAVITLRHNGTDRSIKVGHEINKLRNMLTTSPRHVLPVPPSGESV